MHSEKNQNCIAQLQKALDCMLLVLNNVNDNMHQIGITGFHVNFNILKKIIKVTSNFIIFRVIGMIWGVYFYKDLFLYGPKTKKIC